jgi:hypothetical protein
MVPRIRPNLQQGNSLALLLALLIFGVLIAAAPDALLNGDAAVYAEQIEAADFSQRSLHVGYYLLGAGFTRIVPGASDRELNWMSALFGAFGLVLVAAITRRLTGSSTAAVVAALALATNAVYLENSFLAEVYIVQTALLLLAVWLWLGGHAAAAGIAVGGSILVAPQGLLGLLILWLLPDAASRHPEESNARRTDTHPGRIRRCCIATGLALLPLVILLALNGEDYIYGYRGVGISASAPIRPLFAVKKEAYELVRGYGLILFFIALGTWRMFKESLQRRFLLSVAALAVGTFFVVERFGDVPVQLPTYTLLAPVAAVGAVHLASRSRSKKVWILILLPFLVMVLWSAGALVDARRGAVDFRRLAEEIEWRGKRGSCIVAPWGEGILLEHYIYGATYTGSWIDAEYLTRALRIGPEDGSMELSLVAARRRNHTIKAGQQWDSALAEEREIWLIGSHPEAQRELRAAGYHLSIEPVPGPHRVTRARRL